jgi:hypothetical protein
VKLSQLITEEENKEVSFRLQGKGRTEKNRELMISHPFTLFRTTSTGPIWQKQGK